MANEQTSNQVGFGPCCFCGLAIASTDIDPCRVEVSTNRGRWQVWFCHAECFKERIFKDDEIDLSPAIFD
jgi:hypothetical protein